MRVTVDSERVGCKGKNQDGTPCKASVVKDGWCTFHHPDYKDQIRLGRSKGGSHVHAPHAGDTTLVPVEVRSVQDVFKILDYALAEALAGENSIARNRLLIAIADSYKRVMEAESKAKHRAWKSNMIPIDAKPSQGLKELASGQEVKDEFRQIRLGAIAELQRRGISADIGTTIAAVNDALSGDSPF